MGLTGDISELVKYKAQLEELGDGKAVDKVAQKALPKIEALVDRQFSSASDPYGGNWAPRVADGAPALQTMRGRVTVGVQGAAIVASVVEQPGIYHQMGTSRMVQRMIVPTESMGTPPDWEKALDDASQEVMKESGVAEKAGV